MSQAAVLIVEDEDPIRLTLRDYLEQKGYEVSVASDGVGALKQLIDRSVDILVTDYRMDILGGDYWMKFLNKYEPNLKVIVTSGFLKPDFEVSYPVLFKPFEYHELDQLIQRELEDQK